ncbi:MAG: NitT/TauT family transport system permease protein [Alphaproteobacteria bacterium]|nr:NitT/TauT family transport system permease protein [Alphaproteobacteria bacterium]
MSDALSDSKARHDRSRLRGVAIQIALHGSVLALWEIACRTVIPPLFLPPPSAIAVAFYDTLRSGELPRQLGQTLGVLAVGFGLAVIIGLTLGILMGTVRTAARLLDPYVNALYAMPTVALVPLVIVWLGLGFEAKVFLTFIVGVFPIVINAQAGVKNIPAAYMETARAFACSRSQMFWKVMLPAAIPFFVAGLRLGLGRALVGVVVAEMFTALSGLGYMVTFYGNTFKTALLFVPIITLALLSIAITELIRWAERRITPWIDRS